MPPRSLSYQMVKWFQVGVEGFSASLLVEAVVGHTGLTQNR